MTPHEFMLRLNDGEGWTEPFTRYPELLRPATIPSQAIAGWGSHRLLIEGAEVSFSDEVFGFQVVFESGSVTQARAEEIVADICQHISTQSTSTATLVSL